MRSIVLLPLLAACGVSSPSGDIVGPFTGEVHRFVVDRFELPFTSSDARALGADLDGDHTVDNALGQVIATLHGQDDVTTHAGDMIASGVLETVIEVQADDLVDDPTVGVRYLGASGTPFAVMGGKLEGGVFTSNRTATTAAPGAAELVLPVFVDADPSHIRAFAMEMSFAPAADGGFDARVAGAIDPKLAISAVVAGIRSMVTANPQDHLFIEREFDKNRDGILSDDEIATNTLVSALLWPDVDLYNNGVYAPGSGDQLDDSMSFGFALHLVPCASGGCTGAVADPCHDRVRDRDETDLDCGGSCGACPGGEGCATGADCQTGVCNAGTCTAPSCTDGVKDGYETDVDCGLGCGPCQIGQTCDQDADCATAHCVNAHCSIYPS